MESAKLHVYLSHILVCIREWTMDIYKINDLSWVGPRSHAACHNDLLMLVQVVPECYHCYFTVMFVISKRTIVFILVSNGHLDWPLNASCGFVSISWVSSLIWPIISKRTIRAYTKQKLIRFCWRLTIPVTMRLQEFLNGILAVA